MKVALIDLDLQQKKSNYPNLALMKLSAYHKAKGDTILPLNFVLGADIVYASCVFTWNAKKVLNLPTDSIIGGYGIKPDSVLPPEIEHIKPDYELYGINYSIGFTSRGCIRKCPFCIVPEKEGYIKPWASIYEFWDKRHTKIVLLDNNLLASPNWKETLSALIKEKLLVDFNQGLDIRLVDEEKAFYLSRVKTKILRFSFDNPRYEKVVREGIDTLIKAGIKPSKLSFYVLVGFDTSVEEDIGRIELLASYGCQVFPMIYRNEHGKETSLGKAISKFPIFHGSRRRMYQFLRLAGFIPKSQGQAEGIGGMRKEGKHGSRRAI